jgi:hypothetical protein
MILGFLLLPLQLPTKAPRGNEAFQRQIPERGGQIIRSEVVEILLLVRDSETGPNLLQEFTLVAATHQAQEANLFSTD